jgi:GTPase
VSGLSRVAVVGRPNVGKSTLVNRIVGRREAIVEEKPGVTRDRKDFEAEWLGRHFVVTDTGGWLDTSKPLDAKVSAQAERALSDADLVLFVVDATVGATDEDDRVADLLRRSRRPVMVVANKVDGPNREPDIWEFVRFGLGEPYAVSALHGRQTGDFLDEVVARLPDGGEAARSESDSDDETERLLSLAIVGRPNVGKSTLFNRLVGDERSVVHDMPGTTRDTIDTVIETATGERLKIIDTAGLRHAARTASGTEYYSLVRSLRAIDSADVALLVIDASQGVAQQDQRLAERVDAAGSPVVVVLNKWDLLDTEAREDLALQVEDRLGFVGYAAPLRISGLTGRGVQRLLPAVAEAAEAYRRRVPTAELNRVLKVAQAEHPSPTGRVLYATQGATDPPTFTLFTTKRLHPTYLRYLERRIREGFGFGPTPLKLRARVRGS